jgi:hypothetical protein
MSWWSLQTFLITVGRRTAEPDANPHSPALAQQAVITGHEIASGLFRQGDVGSAGSAKAQRHQLFGPLACRRHVWRNRGAQLLQQKLQVIAPRRIRVRCDLDFVRRSHCHGP